MAHDPAHELSALVGAVLGGCSLHGREGSLGGLVRRHVPQDIRGIPSSLDVAVTMRGVIANRPWPCRRLLRLAEASIHARRTAGAPA